MTVQFKTRTRTSLKVSASRGKKSNRFSFDAIGDDPILTPEIFLDCHRRVAIETPLAIPDSYCARYFSYIVYVPSKTRRNEQPIPLLGTKIDA